MKAIHLCNAGHYTDYEIMQQWRFTTEECFSSIRSGGILQTRLLLSILRCLYLDEYEVALRKPFVAHGRPESRLYTFQRTKGSL